MTGVQTCALPIFTNDGIPIMLIVSLIVQCRLDIHFYILAVVLLIGVGVPIRNKLIRKYRDKKQDEKKNMPE